LHYRDFNDAVVRAGKEAGRLDIDNRETTVG
jgi:hypothetical protein